MTRKIILVTDPGIDDAFAATLALFDPHLELVAICGSAGNVSAEQANRNIHILVEQLDPPRWPRIGVAPAVSYETDATRLHGPDGLGGVSFECAHLHHPHPADKLIVELANQYRGEITLVVLSPLTVVARALDRNADLARSLNSMVIMGGSWQAVGNAGPVSEFHFFCDPPAARQVLGSGAMISLIPLDVARQALFSPTELMDLTGEHSKVSRFLRKIITHGISASAEHFGIEGFYLHDVLAVAMTAMPQAFKTRPMTVDVETRGELTSGMSVVDQRPQRADPNVNLVVEIDMQAVRDYMRQVLLQPDAT